MPADRERALAALVRKWDREAVKYEERAENDPEAAEGLILLAVRTRQMTEQLAAVLRAGPPRKEK